MHIIIIGFEFISVILCLFQVYGLSLLVFVSTYNIDPNEVK